MSSAKFVETVRSALAAELEELRDEVRKIAESVKEDQLWQRPMDSSNSLGHLILHLTGNINHFVGAQLGNTGFVRDREREFTEASPPARANVLQKLDEAVAVFRRIVGGLTEEQLMAPHDRFGNVTKALVHVVAHFALHRGQMSYIARLVAKL
jgi:uncharacterized damage-inducible protein DinB